jgi:hypothetical protein
VCHETQPLTSTRHFGIARYFDLCFVLADEVVDADKTFVVQIHLVEYGVDAACFAPGVHLQAFSVDLDMPLELAWT